MSMLSTCGHVVHFHFTYFNYALIILKLVHSACKYNSQNLVITQFHIIHHVEGGSWIHVYSKISCTHFYYQKFCFVYDYVQAAVLSVNPEAQKPVWCVA